MAVLSIEAADVQVDCLHRLIAGLCAADGGVELLCRLPWAHNLLVRLPELACVVCGLAMAAGGWKVGHLPGCTTCW